MALYYCRINVVEIVETNTSTTERHCWLNHRLCFRTSIFSLSSGKNNIHSFFMIYGCRHCKRVMLTSHNQSVRNSIHIISYNLFQYAQVASTCCWCFCCCLLFLIYDASNNDVFNTIQTDESFRCSLVFVWLAVICSIFESIYLRKASIFILLLFSVRMNAMNTYEI